jgi:DNA-binding MarR family transcriptional regulator
VPSREQTIDQIRECFWDVFRAINPPATPDWLGLDLTMAQLKALFALARGEPMTVGALGQVLRIQLPAASHAVDSLVRLELAKRYEDPEDRRRTFVQLTSRGQALVEQLREGRSGLSRRWLAELADDDLAALLRGLQAIAAVAAHHIGMYPIPAEQLSRRHDPPAVGRSHPCAANPDVRKLEEETQ